MLSGKGLGEGDEKKNLYAMDVKHEGLITYETGEYIINSIGSSVTYPISQNVKVSEMKEMNYLTLEQYIASLNIAKNNIVTDVYDEEEDVEYYQITLNDTYTYEELAAYIHNQPNGDVTVSFLNTQGKKVKTADYSNSVASGSWLKLSTKRTLSIDANTMLYINEEIELVVE